MAINLLKTSSYHYELPKELIAQNPAEPRDSCRLLVLDSKDGRTEHREFGNIGEFLRAGDLLVLNDTRVLPARIKGVKRSGATKVEIFCLRPAFEGSNVWIALVKPGRKLPSGSIVSLGDNVDVVIGERLEDGLRSVAFPNGSDSFGLIHRFGCTPLPHYITHSVADPEQYQTVYAKLEKENSVAAPTAGLHFTKELMARICALGVDQTFITLQVGLGTFRPVKSEDVSEHIMHSEFCEIPEDAARKINATKKKGGRVIAVGTTVVRTLESFAKIRGGVEPGVLDTRLFITPGFDFQVIDALITNFHLPKSTLLMLVSAFGGYEAVMAAYNEAVAREYRFFSFGDAMLVGTHMFEKETKA